MYTYFKTISYILGHFFSFTLSLCGLSTLIQVVVINIYHRGERRMPVWMNKSILKPLSVITLTKAHWQDSKVCILNIENKYNH